MDYTRKQDPEKMKAAARHFTHFDPENPDALIKVKAMDERGHGASVPRSYFDRCGWGYWSANSWLTKPSASSHW
jgi:hypothetical protein